MAFAQSRLYKPALVLLAAALLASSFFSERKLNQLRGSLGFTRVTPLENAPPMLVMTTVVLGGFRGLIANALWVRAMELQDEDKYFEMVQLADWITKLQPHMVTVWVVQAWNMSYNISIKFSDPPDRWAWVNRGISLLRDEALKYNPHEVLLYRELAWQFQHKMGMNLDDAHMYFKNVWASEMQEVLGSGRPNFDELINPKTDEAKARVKVLREKYKMDPVKMKEVDDRYGPLEWRFPETHAIYWAQLGRDMAKTPQDLITLRRVIFQSMQLAFQRGTLIQNPDKSYRIGPNLDIIPKANASYEEMMAEDPEMRDNISRAHKNFLLNSVYSLYVHNRLREANQWLDVVKKKYPKDYNPNLSLDEFALSQVAEDLGDTNMDKTTADIMGFLEQAYQNLALGEDDQYTSLIRLARNMWTRYTSKIRGGPSDKRVSLAPLEDMSKEVLDRMLDPEKGLRPQLAAQLRTKLNLPAPTNAPPTEATSPNPPAPRSASTNSVAPPK